MEDGQLVGQHILVFFEVQLSSVELVLDHLQLLLALLEHLLYPVLNIALALEHVGKTCNFNILLIYVECLACCLKKTVLALT